MALSAEERVNRRRVLPMKFTDGFWNFRPA
jgi:hypothetical protein